MRSLLARLAVLGAFAVSMSACSNGVGGTSLPFSGLPNSAGGGTGLLQSGATGSALLRFVHGAPDIGTVDICVDQASVGGTNSTSIKYKASTLAPIALSAGTGIAHTISIYPVPTTGAGTECATAPGPYFGTAALATTTLNAAVNTRNYLVLGGRAGTTLGLYYYPGPASFVNPPSAPEAQVFNASPTFGKVGIGYTAGGTSANLIASLNAPVASKATATVTTAGSSGSASLPSQPTSFFAGKPVTSGTVVPLITEPAAALVAGNTYVASVFSIDSTNAVGLDVVSFFEQTTGYGF